MSRLTRPRPWVVLTVLLAGQMMASMDGSIVTVALPSIQHDLRVDDAVLQLVPSAYLLTLGVLNVTGARTGDLIGHRRAFLGGLAAFTLASLLCGLAPAAPVLVAARVAQAVAAALMVPQVFSLIQLRFDGSARKRAIGVYSMVLALGVALGQVIGGLVVGADLLGLTWRPVFLVNVPVGAVLMVVGLRALPESAPVARRLDLGGVALLTAAMSAVIVPLIFGRQYGWPEWAWASLLARPAPAGGPREVRGPGRPPGRPAASRSLCPAACGGGSRARHLCRGDGLLHRVPVRADPASPERARVRPARRRARLRAVRDRVRHAEPDLGPAARGAQSVLPVAG